MTQARLVNTIPQWSDCSVYRFIVRDPNTNYTTRRVGYIGETARMPLDRLIEHLRKKDWGDTIVGWEVIEENHPDKASVLRAEKAAVLREKPLYNDEYQRGAAHQIPLWEQQRQRAERDAARRAAGGNGMQPTSTPRQKPTERSAPSRTPQRSTSRLSAKWRRRRNVALAYGGGWLGLFSVLWLAGALYVAPDPPNDLPGRLWPTLAACVATGALGLPNVRKRHRMGALVGWGITTLILAGMAVDN